MTVRVEFVDGVIVYSSGRVKSSKLVELLGDERVPDTMEMMLDTKLAQAQIMKIKEEANLLGVPAIRFTERASGLNKDIKDSKEIMRSELDSEIRKRSN